MKITETKFLIYLFVLMFAFSSCGNNDDDEITDGDWWEVAFYNGFPCSDGVMFVIDDKAYFGTGYDGDDRLTAFSVYDITGNSWKSIADFPGAARTGAVAFSIDGKGYVGTGYDGEDELSDFWEYNPSTDTWKQVADFLGGARYKAVSFAIGGKGYVGTGYDGRYYNDFYSYDPGSDTWEEITPSYGGRSRRGAATFVIGTKAYLVSGMDNGVYLDDVFEFDSSNGTWTEKREISASDDDASYDDDYTTIARIDGVGFSVNGKGYLVTGGPGSMINNVWEYDPGSDLWAEKTSFEGTARTDAVGFGYGNYGYVGTGRSSSYYFYDMWCFDPEKEYDEDN